MKLISTLPLVVVLAASLASAQQQQQPLADSGGGRVEFISPDVHPDHTVTISISAPAANDVKVRVANRDYPMKKSANGVWSAIVGPLEPEIYNYTFNVDSARVHPVIDGNSLDDVQFEIPGNPPRYDEIQKVPHGTIVLHTYDSKVQGRVRHFRVYLPPQYYTEPNRKFPVLYLFNGGDEIGWTQMGKVDIVLDNLIAQNKAVPMIIVMPHNRIHGENVAQIAPFAATAKTPEERGGLAASLDTIATFEKELPTDIEPIVEEDYRILSGRDNTAIAGLSFGGGTAFGVGMRHLDKYAWIGEFATGTFGGTANPPSGYIGYGDYNPDTVAPGMYKNLLAQSTKPKLLYMSCGETDPRLSFQKKAYEEFKKNGIEPVFMTFPGGHEMKFFRRAMADFVTRIFKNSM